MAVMKPAFRRLAIALLALLMWGAAAPLLAVRCVPGAACARTVKTCPLAFEAQRPTEVAVGARGCCVESARGSEPAAVPGAPLQAPSSAGVPLAVAALRAAPRGIEQRASAEALHPPPVPLYTLHSILLI
jgi:hypothetical protein